jgi:hypothetical protein
MIFGAGNNPTHWKHLSKDKGVRINFEKRILKATKKNSKELENYLSEMKHFRDKYAAHRIVNFNTKTPKLTLATEKKLILTLPKLFNDLFRCTAKYNVNRSHPL